jgi:hypothetical protein
MAMRIGFNRTRRPPGDKNDIAWTQQRPRRVEATRPPGRVASTRSAGLVTVVLVTGIVGVSLIAALDIASRLTQTSDSVQGFVEGYALARGNILLSGWHLPLDNYYFTDTIPYAAMEWIVGPWTFLLALIPAITYGLFVCAGLAFCLRRAHSPTQNVEAGAAAALMLAPSGWIGSWNPLLMSNMHFMTTLFALVALALCARIATLEQKGALLFGHCALFALIVSTTIASDPFSLFFGFGPALALFSVDALRYGLKSSERIALFMLTATVIAGATVPFLIARAGGFTTEANVIMSFASPALIGRSVIAVVGGILRLSGANPTGTSDSLRAAAFLALRWCWLAVAVAAVLHASRGLLRRDRSSLLERLLCAGVLSVLLACVLSAQFGKGIQVQNPWAGGPAMRYAMPAVMFGAILGARRIPELISALRSARVRLAARGALTLLAVALCADASEIPGEQPRWISRSPPAMAARWLAERGLTTGDADYWSANLVTAMSGVTLDLRSVVPEDGKAVPYSLSADTRRRGPPQFMIWQDGTKSGMTSADVRATYSVCRTELIASYRIALVDAGHGQRCASTGAKSPV